MKLILLIVSALFVACVAANGAPKTALAIDNLSFNGDRTALMFRAGEERYTLNLRQAEETLPGDGHYQGAVEGSQDSIAHVNAHDDGRVDVTMILDGELHFVDYDDKSGKYMMFKSSDLPVDGDFIPFDGDVVSAPDAVVAQAQSEAAQSRAERPSSYKVVAYWEQNPHPRVGGNARTLVSGYFSSLNTLVMQPKGLPLFSVTMRKALKGRGNYPDNGDARALSHDWFSNYVNSHQSEVSGANFVMWHLHINMGGRAYIGTACNSAYGMRYKTGVTGTVVGTNYYDRAWTMRTMAHEAGHLLGAPHNFGSQSIMDYYWPQGTTAQKVGYFNSVDIGNMRNVGCA